MVSQQRPAAAGAFTRRRKVDLVPTTRQKESSPRQYRASSASDELRRYLEQHSSPEEEYPRVSGPPVPTPLRERVPRREYDEDEDLEAATDELDRAALAVERARRSYPVAASRTDRGRRRHLDLVRDVSLHLESSSLALADAAQLLARLDAGGGRQLRQESQRNDRQLPSYDDDDEEEEEEDDEHEEVDILTPEFLASFKDGRGTVE